MSPAVYVTVVAIQYCLSEKKKQNSNRAKGVGVVSILAMVKNAKKWSF
jgi:hypothetical protein